MDDHSFPSFADVRQVRGAKWFGVGVNWYFTKGIRLLVDFDYTRFQGGAAGGDRTPERAILSRIQHAF